jgi:small redox-active disulfide protein 2
MDIKILGSGCSNCITLEQRTRQALTDLGRSDDDDRITKVTDFADIASYGVMSTPALVVDEQVLVAGKVLSVSQLKTLLQN